MNRGYRWLRRYAPALLVLLLPGILLYSSLRTFRELRLMQEVFLRNRAAAVAARLETMTGGEEAERLAEEEPGVLTIRIFERPGSGAPLGLWNGEQLFVTQTVKENGGDVYRAFVPFHERGVVHVAQIDLDPASADFLLVHARHNLGIAALSGVAILLLAGYALWAMRREADEEKQRLALAHLAHVGKLAAVLAHEIRTPLSTIKGFTQLALEKADEGVRPLLTPVVGETQRLERLVSDLLLYARPPQPAVQACRWDDLGTLLRGAGAEVDSAPIEFRTDPGILRHVLENLIRNGLEAVAGKADGWVRASVHPMGDVVVIAVEDNGPGIPEESRQRVFESFFTTKAAGTGLGLPIARSLAEALGGRVVLRTRPGGGVRAEVWLPDAGGDRRGVEAAG